MGPRRGPERRRRELQVPRAGRLELREQPNFVVRPRAESRGASCRRRRCCCCFVVVLVVVVVFVVIRGISGLPDLLAGAARALKPGSGILVAAERIRGSGASGLVRGLTGLGGASASLALADLEGALEAAPGFSMIALDVVCAGTDPHAVVVAFRDETSVFGVVGQRRSAAAGTEEEDALAAALNSGSKAKRTKGGSSKKGFK